MSEDPLNRPKCPAAGAIDPLTSMVWNGRDCWTRADALVEDLDQARRDRDHYKKALKEIANYPALAPIPPHKVVQHMQDIAQAALDSTPPPSSSPDSP